MTSTKSLPARIRVGAVRTWIAFSVSSFTFAVLFAIFDGDNPLRSDDPYILGLIAAAFTAGFSCFLATAYCLGLSSVVQRMAYFIPLSLIAAALIVFDFASPSPEGQGIPTMLAIVIAISGCLAYPLHSLKLTPVSVTLASIPGLVFMIGYACALVAIAR